jgi:hypothetical protein
VKELQKNGICLHVSGSPLRLRPQTIPSPLFRYAIVSDRRMDAENALCNEPFKSFVVAWVVGGGVTRLIQDEESQGMFFTATSLKAGLADISVLSNCASQWS